MALRFIPWLLAALILGAGLGGAQPAQAFGVDTAEIVAAIAALQKAVGNWFEGLGNRMTSAFSDMTNPNSVSRLLQDGFTQDANYSKAQIGAQQGIADANNEIQAQQAKQLQDAHIRDEHVASPEFCAALDANQGQLAASNASWKAATGIGIITDPRGESEPNTPSHMSSAQGAQANNNLHMSHYCTAGEVADGLCSGVSQYPAADERAYSLFGTDTLSASGSLDAAKDFMLTLTQPVAPAALRGDEMKSIEGQQAWVRRRSYNARMSLAQGVMNYAIGLHTPSIAPNAQQTTELQAEGQTVPDKMSWLQNITLEVTRRFAGVTWNAQLQAMPPPSVERELAVEMALNNYLQLQNFRLNLLNATVDATQLAQKAEHDLDGPATMPAPNLSSN